MKTRASVASGTKVTKLGVDAVAQANGGLKTRTSIKAGYLKINH